jgi:hydroxymethylglutaryl-CoA lyase
MTRVLAAYPEDRIALREVGLRDGLQMTKSWPTTTQKLQWVTRGTAARYFETGSFLPADKVPRFADVREVIGAVAAQGAHGVALARNKRRAQRGQRAPYAGTEPVGHRRSGAVA